MCLINENIAKKIVYIEECFNIIDNFVSDEILKNEFYVTLAMDAASFKPIKGYNIIRKFPQLSGIIMNNTYDNLFIFLYSE